MTLTEQITINIVHKLIKGEDYRIEIINIINAEFLQFVIGFFKRVAEAKLNSANIDTDWYRKEMLNNELPTDEIIINSGLNKKTITNMRNSATRAVVIEASYEHYDALYRAIDSLTKVEDLNISLQIKFKKVSVELDVNESLIVINTLAVKRAAIRGGLWSTAGKQTETPLMIALCEIFNVPSDNYATKLKPKKVKEGTVNREVDFFLIKDQQRYKCEVKLMGKGNPESADVVIARDSRVFVADKLSDQNKAQLEQRNVEWVELRGIHGYEKFGAVLKKMKIDHKAFSRIELDTRLKQCLSEMTF